MATDFVPNLAVCRTPEQLAVALGLDEQLLMVLSGDSRSTYYQIHKIPKRSSRRIGQFRVVYEPRTDELKLVHRTLARRLALYAGQAQPDFPADCSNGYIRGRSTKRNAKAHCGATLLLNADIKDFFPSISVSRAEATLIRLQVKSELASVLARVFCLHGTLTPGLSASPLIANLACHDLDLRMMQMTAALGAAYTRYADDISISGDALPSKSQIADALAAEGFQLCSSKFRITRRGQAQFVTGLSVSDSKRPHVPKAMKRGLRQELYYAGKFGVAEHLQRTNENLHEGASRLRGTVQYVAFVEEQLRSRLLADWESIADRDDLQMAPLPRHDQVPMQRYAAIDEAIIEKGETKYLAVGCALFSERQTIEQAIRQTSDNYLADPYSAGDKTRLRKEGLHFAAAHPDLITAFISKLPNLPFRCYVALKVLGSDAEYGAHYRSLLLWVANILFDRCDRQLLEVSVERNPQVAEPIVKGTFSALYVALATTGLKRPLVEPSVSAVGKQQGQIAIPDFMLGILGRLVQTRKSSDGAALSQFERLRDRYSLIMNLDTKQAYHRRRPFSPSALDPQP